MLLKSREIHSLFFQLSESVNLLRGRFNLLTNATPDVPSFLQPTQYTEEWTSRHLPLADVRASTCYSHRRLKVSPTPTSRTSSPLSRQPANWSLSRGLTWPYMQYYSGGEWWKTRSICCFWVIKTLLEANTSTFRLKQGRTLLLGVVSGPNWGPVRWFIINEKISISRHFTHSTLLAICQMSH